MKIQKQQTKVRAICTAMILGLMCMCSNAAFASFTASSTSLQFPNQTIGTTSAPIPVTVTNTNSQSITIGSVSTSAAQFSYFGPAGPFTLAPGQSITANVTFTPSAAQTYNATLTVRKHNGQRILSVSLRGSGIQAAVAQPALTASASAMTFSAQAGGASPAGQSLTIGANPASAVAFTVAADQPWINLSASSGTTSSAIQVGANISGLAAGNYSGHVIVSAAGVTNSPISIAVALSVTAPQTHALTAAPSSLAFSGVAGGASPATQSLTIGENPAGAVAYTVAADQAWMTLSAASGTTSSTIQVGANTSGLAAGNYTGHVIVTAAGVTNSPMSVTVTLAVTAAQTKALTASPSTFAFSMVLGGAAPAGQILTVGENPAGALPFTITGDQPWINVSFFSGTTPGTIQVSVTNLSGLAAGNYSGHLIVSATGVSNSPMSIPVTLAITTATQTSTLAVSPTSLAFGNINLTNNNTKTVTVTNSGTGSVTISSVGVVGLGLSANGIATPMTLSGGQSTVLSIVYAPTVVGALNGTVSVVSNATNSPSVITTTGAGVQPSLTASPSTLNFGSVVTGTSASQTITISNTGSAAATISSAVVSGTGFTMSGSALPMTLAAGASTSFSVKFAPSAAGTDAGSVTVTSNTPNSPTLVALNGTATAPAPVAHSVSLSWVASTSTVVGYNVYRGTISGGPYALLNSTPDAALSYTDTAVTAGQTYYYVVTAVDSNGVESIVSNEVSATIPTP